MPGISAFCFLLSTFYFHSSLALPGLPRFEVRGSKFGVHHKPPEYISSPAPPSGRSGGTLDKPWICPGTIEPRQPPVFDQPGLSKVIHPPLRRLRSARTVGVFPVAPPVRPQRVPYADRVTYCGYGTCETKREQNGGFTSVTIHEQASGHLYAYTFAFHTGHFVRYSAEAGLYGWNG
jgi:hypothetical protein